MNCFNFVCSWNLNILLYFNGLIFKYWSKENAMNKNNIYFILSPGNLHILSTSVTQYSWFTWTMHKESLKYLKSIHRTVVISAGTVSIDHLPKSVWKWPRHSRAVPNSYLEGSWNNQTNPSLGEHSQSPSFKLVHCLNSGFPAFHTLPKKQDTF